MQFTFMRKGLVAAAMLLLCVQACARSLRPEQGSTKNSAEQEIRAALCDMDKRDYASAQKKLEQILQTDPKNIYAQKLLASTLANEIKIGEDSAQNSEIARRAIEAYQRVSNNPKTSAAEKTEIDHFALSLYRRISAEEQRKEIERRVSDSTRTARDRSELYAVLASQSWDCAYRITSKQTLPEKAEIERAANCVSKGLEYANQAIALDGENESAWSYKANLLREAATLAGFANNQTLKASYQQQADEAEKRQTEVIAKRGAEEDKEWARQDEERKKNESVTPEHVEEVSKELVEYKAETSLDEAVKSAFIPVEIELTTLVAPVPIPQEKTERTETSVSPTPTPKKGCFREADGTAQVQEKRDWKSFAPSNEDIIVDLPDNVCAPGAGYMAASEGVMYRIVSIPRRPDTLDPFTVDKVLNTAARTYMGTFLSGPWLGKGLGNSFELKFLRKEDFSGQPRKVYAYALISCSQRKEGVLIVQASKAHYYTFDISGANESDARVQRFLRSIKVK
jgi:tetratricopeptide (TPR) repeat protein